MKNEALNKPEVISSAFCCGIFPNNNCIECGYYKQELKNKRKMKLQELKNKKTVMIKPSGLINYREMKVTPTQTGFTISNYGHKKIADHEYLFVVDCQSDLDALDILQ